MSAAVLDRRALAAIFSSSLGVGLIFGFQPPLIALTLSRAGASSFAVGAVTAASLIAVILLGPFYPRAIRRLGLKTCIVGGVVVAALDLLLMARWPSVPAWIGLRLINGCVLGLAWIASEIWMNQATDDASRGAVMGIYGAVFSLGVVLGPVLLELTGTVGAWPFVCGALCLLATLVPLALRRSAAAPLDPRAPREQLLAAVRTAPVVMLAAVVAGLVESADLALLPLFGLHAGLDERAALLLVTLFMAGNVILQTPIGLLADRIGRRTVLALCAIASGLGPLLLPLCLHQPWVLGVLLFSWGGTLYAFYSQGVALMGEEFAPSELAAANTVFVMVYCAGGIVGPSMGGLAMDLWPRAGLPLFLSAAPLALLVGLRLWPARARARALGALLILALLVAPARGQGNYEIQVYGADTVPPRNLLLELHSNFTAIGQTQSIDGVYPTNHQEHETLELTEGLNSWSELGFYVFTSEQDGHGAQWVGDHIRPRVRVPESWGWPVGVSLSTEVGYQRSVYSPDTWTWELRPIVDKTQGCWYFAVNPALERTLHGPDVREGWSFSPAVKIGYALTPVVSPGLEYYGDYGALRHFATLHDQQQQLFAVADLDVSPLWEINVGVGIGATGATDHLIFKAILGRRFDWGRRYAAPR